MQPLPDPVTLASNCSIMHTNSGCQLQLRSTFNRCFFCRMHCSLKTTPSPAPAILDHRTAALHAVDASEPSSLDFTSPPLLTRKWKNGSAPQPQPQLTASAGQQVHKQASAHSSEQAVASDGAAGKEDKQSLQQSEREPSSSAATLKAAKSKTKGCGGCAACAQGQECVFWAAAMQALKMTEAKARADATS